MVGEETEDGVAAGRRRLDRTERRFWREIWESVPPGVATEQGIEMKSFGPLQAAVVTSLPGFPRMNLTLGAAEPGAIATAASRRRWRGRTHAGAKASCP
jgi:hypothetical protein